MKKILPLAFAALVGAAALNSAQAASVSHGTQTLDLSKKAVSYGASFTSGLAGGLFTDKFNFTLASGSSLQADVSSTAQLTRGLDITDFRLVGSNGQVLYSVNQVSTGMVDLWKIHAGSLNAGNYTLEIVGKVNSQFAGSYSGNVLVQALPVPEADTYAMLLAGLGLVGVVARRRKSA
ncbi:PEP-CTERM sorting domain-containing protein [Rugamonas sp. FT107W]|uniref:PEP-CTERM sorting domain-containing protein n=1 Tax=Duganella vulcania TaxID=2692166 RepID=A0A845HM99_9BURK|nr:FxDxF family PEP-CTERM protein [Duganella vulcania]MYN17666.1 PEP-CTERM sorting domain-containing protein [Duganella vulcania]